MYIGCLLFRKSFYGVKFGGLVSHNQKTFLIWLYYDKLLLKHNKTMTTTDEAVDNLAEQFADVEDVSRSDIRSKLENLVNEYSVPIDEAERSVRNHFTEEADIDVSDISGGDQDVLVNEVEQDDIWVNIEVKVVDLWDNLSDSTSQAGLVGDESGDSKFIAFESSDLPKLEEGKSYRLEGVVTDEYEGRMSFRLNKSTEIIELDEEVEVGDNTEELSGAIVDIKNDSGLIKRCPQEDCTRILRDGRCPEHGPQDDFEFDLRIKCVIDDGNEAYTVIFSREEAESITGITLDRAKTKAQDSLDFEWARKQIEEQLLGRYVTVQGNPRYDMFFVEEFHMGVNAPDAEELLIKARSI